MRVVSMREKAKRLEERKRVLGIDASRFAVARNAGIARTPAKRALLRTLAEVARQQGRSAFVANY
jgi:hypothetical protein